MSQEEARELPPIRRGCMCRTCKTWKPAELMDMERRVCLACAGDAQLGAVQVSMVEAVQLTLI